MNTIEVYTVKDIREILKICRNGAYRLVKSGEFPVIKIGDTYRISKVVFEAWMNQK
jgi:excisionase family DNA binding protein